MNAQWIKFQEEALDGLRLLIAEMHVFLREAREAPERITARRALRELDRTVLERYREVGEKIYEQFISGHSLSVEGDMKVQFEELERLHAQRQALLKELEKFGGEEE